MTQKQLEMGLMDIEIAYQKERETRLQLLGELRNKADELTENYYSKLRMIKGQIRELEAEIAALKKQMLENKRIVMGVYDCQQEAEA